MLRGRGGCGPSATASVPIALPAASCGSHFFFCASEPASFSASVASTTEVSNGTGAAARPISSATTQSSSGERPRPPILFGNADARHAELDEALPDLLGMGFVAVEHAAHDLGRALVGEELADLLLEQLLVVGEIEVHDGRA